MAYEFGKKQTGKLVITYLTDSGLCRAQVTILANKRTTFIIDGDVDLLGDRGRAGYKLRGHFEDHYPLATRYNGQDLKREVRQY